MKLAALLVAIVLVVLVAFGFFAIRGLRKFVRAIWPHS
jgi:hypothetical protein